MSTSITPASASSTAGDSPATTHPAYERMEPRWGKCRTLMGSTQDIRDGKEDFLVRFPDETDDSYELRLNLVALFNGFKRTIFAIVGMLLQKDPVLGKDVPAKLRALAENIDAGGAHLAVFVRDLAQHGVIDGHSGILVEYPRVANPESISIDDEARLGLRPYFIEVKADDQYLPRYRTINGKKTLWLLVIREVVEIDNGRFGVQNEIRYRVYSRADNESGPRVEYELWKEPLGGGTPKLSEGPAPLLRMTRIPFVRFVGGEKVSDVETRPALEDLADLVIEHHQVKTNLRHLESRAMVPTPVRIGARPDKDGNYPEITLGPGNTIEAPQVDGVQEPIYWLSPPVDVLDPGAKSLETIKGEMGAAGLAFLAPETRAAETAEAKRIDATAQRASLATTARNLQDAIETAFGFAAEYMGLDFKAAGSVTVNRDFEKTVMTSDMVSALGNLATNGKLSLETLLELLERGMILGEGFDVNAEVKRILQQNALPTEPPAPEPNPPTAE